MDAKPKHPAKFNKNSLTIMANMLDGCKRILDPMAGTGEGLDFLAEVCGCEEAWGIEIELEWIVAAHRVRQGNALYLPWPDNYFDAIVTSPTFGNRMADHHNAKDPSKRVSYTHNLGRPLSDGNSGRMHWGPEYRIFHIAAWLEARRVLKIGGRFIMEIKDHIRKGVVVPVTDWHVETLSGLSFTLLEHNRIEMAGMRHGANRGQRVASGSVLHMVLTEKR